MGPGPVSANDGRCCKAVLPPLASDIQTESSSGGRHGILLGQEAGFLHQLFVLGFRRGDPGLERVT